MSSRYEELFGERGPGKPAKTIEVLPGVGTAQERAKAKRRAMAVLAEQHKDRLRLYYKLELLSIVERANS